MRASSHPHEAELARRPAVIEAFCNAANQVAADTDHDAVAVALLHRGSVVAVSGELTGASSSVIATAVVGGPVEDLEVVAAIDDRADPVAVQLDRGRVHRSVDGVASVLATFLSAQQELDEARRRAVEAEHDAATDALTGLADHGEWWRAVERCDAQRERTPIPVVVAVVDLDDLKSVNDREGHPAGDRLIGRAGEVLGATVRQGDVVARVGGDEFAVLAFAHEGDPRDFAAKLTETLGQAGVSASVGAVRVGADESIRDAFARADQAMYRAKRRRRATSGGSR